MTARFRFAFTVAPLLLAAAACGGKTAGLTTSPPAPTCPVFDGERRCPPGVDAGVDSSVGPVSTCVEVDPTHFDTACSVDSDCTLVLTGDVCATDCQCEGDTAINTSSLSQYIQAIHGITLQNCHCAARATPRCIDSQCTTCSLVPDGVTCGDAGVVGVGDSGIILPGDASLEDAGAADAAVTCVDVNPADYSTSCSVNSDCFLIQTGKVCDGQCACGGSPASTLDEAMYDSTISGVQFAECGCPAGPDPVCTNGQCVLEALGG